MLLLLMADSLTRNVRGNHWRGFATTRAVETSNDELAAVDIRVDVVVDIAVVDVGAAG